MANSLDVLWSRFSWGSNIYLPQLISDVHYTDRFTGAVSCSRKHNSTCWTKNPGPLSYQINAHTINQHAHTHVYIWYWHTTDKHMYIINIHENLMWSPMYELKLLDKLMIIIAAQLYTWREMQWVHTAHTHVWHYNEIIQSQIFTVCNCKTNHSHDQPQHSIGIK